MVGHLEGGREGGCLMRWGEGWGTGLVWRGRRSVGSRDEQSLL